MQTDVMNNGARARQPGGAHRGGVPAVATPAARVPLVPDDGAREEIERINDCLHIVKDYLRLLGELSLGSGKVGEELEHLSRGAFSQVLSDLASRCEVAAAGLETLLSASKPADTGAAK